MEYPELFAALGSNPAALKQLRDLMIAMIDDAETQLRKEPRPSVVLEAAGLTSLRPCRGDASG